MSLVGRGCGQRENLSRNHVLGQVIHACEIVLTAHARYLAPVKQNLESKFAVVPVPPRALLANALVEVARHHRAVDTNPIEHLIEVAGAAGFELVDGIPPVPVVHPPAHQRV